MNRVEAIEKIYEENKNAFFILSNGLTSREAAFFLPQDNSLYLLHAMGESLSVAVGLASSNKNLNIVVIEGDGNALMGASAWNINTFKNIKYYILKNGTYCTTGSQILPEFQSLPKWCNVIEIENGSFDTPNPPSPDIIIKNVKKYLKELSNEK